VYSPIGARLDEGSAASLAGFERHWARLAAEAAGVEPPQWALQSVPEVTVVGPPIAAQE
jgi:hypothetical protein